MGRGRNKGRQLRNVIRRGAGMLTLLGGFWLYLAGLDRVEAFVNRLLYGSLVSINDWIYLKGDAYAAHRWPRVGTVRILGIDLDRRFWIVYWVACDTPGALVPSEAYCDECFYPAHSIDFGATWIRGGNLPDEMRGIMFDTFATLTYDVVMSQTAIYQKRYPSPDCLYFRFAGHRDWTGGPCAFNGIEDRHRDFDLLAIDPTDPRHLFVRKNRSDEHGIGITGLWESLDCGQSFTPVMWAPRARWVSNEGGHQSLRSGFNILAIDPFDPKTLLWDEDDWLMLSNDAGKKWRRVFPERNDLDGKARPLFAFPRTSWRIRNQYYAAVFDHVRPGQVYVSSNRGLLVSKDSGQTWRLANIGTGGLWPELTVCVVADAKAVFVGSRRGLHRSTDGGETWELIPLNFQGSWWRNLLPYVPCPQK